MQTRRSPGQIHGGHAKLNVWNPIVNPDTFSLAQIWVLGGSSSQLNSMEAGWHVSIYVLLIDRLLINSSNLASSIQAGLTCIEGYIPDTAC